MEISLERLGFFLALITLIYSIFIDHKIINKIKKLEIDRATLAADYRGPFVASAKLYTYHYPSCTATRRIRFENLVTFSRSTDAMIAGYSPCRICHPI